MTQALRTLPEALELAARSTEGYVFMRGAAEARCSYAEIHQASLRVASTLRETGLRHGDLVALIISDTQQFLTTLFGTSLAGLTPAAVAPPAIAGGPSTYFELTARTLSTARARAIVASPPLVAGFDAVRGRYPDVKLILSSDEVEGAPVEPDTLPRLDDLAFVQFTSGSTSAPKGVALSHRNLCANIDAINGPAGLATTAADSAVSWLPLYHDMGLVGMALGPLYSSRPVTLLTPQAFVKRPAEWLKAISRTRATVSFAPNFAYDLAVRRIRDSELEGVDLSSWRIAGCGAEPIHASTLAAFAGRFLGSGFRATSFFPCYGLAEHVLAATLPPRDRALRVEQTASAEVVGCGRSLPGHQLRLIKEDGAEAAEREIGEITLAGPSVMQGYYNDPAATAAVIRNGWLHTGDLGYIDGGELFVCGRVKDLIIVNGRKYHPQDLEWAVDDVAGVRHGRVAAFGVEQVAAGDRVVIIAETSGAGSTDILVDAIRRRISDAFGLYVDDVILVGSGTIARTTSGKVQRAAIKARYASSNP